MEQRKGLKKNLKEKGRNVCVVSLLKEKLEGGKKIFLQQFRSTFVRYTWFARKPHVCCGPYVLRMQKDLVPAIKEFTVWQQIITECGGCSNRHIKKVLWKHRGRRG